VGDTHPEDEAHLILLLSDIADLQDRLDEAEAGAAKFNPEAQRQALQAAEQGLMRAQTASKITTLEGKLHQLEQVLLDGITQLARLKRQIGTPVTAQTVYSWSEPMCRLWFYQQLPGGDT
jgi:hypothetical protein